MVFILFLFVLFVLPGTAGSTPFLVSDPYGSYDLQPTAFDVTVNGRTDRVAPKVYPDGSSFLHYDLGDLPDGEHVLKVKAVNENLGTESAEEQCRVRKKDGVCSLAPKPREKMPPTRTFRGYKTK